MEVAYTDELAPLLGQLRATDPAARRDAAQGLAAYEHQAAVACAAPALLACLQDTAVRGTTASKDRHRHSMTRTCVTAWRGFQTRKVLGGCLGGDITRGVPNRSLARALGNADLNSYAALWGTIPLKVQFP